ncbi:MAG: hypothetical protein JWN86_2720 [Planctomycetota bacterium]|nr:hypothetical protein [Planctomycetota bacterium]
MFRFDHEIVGFPVFFSRRSIVVATVLVTELIVLLDGLLVRLCAGNANSTVPQFLEALSATL